jgi:hypothetical protein
VLGAAKRLSEQGLGPTLEIAEKLTHALRTGSADELRQLGINLSQTSDKAKVVTEALERFQKLYSSPPSISPQLEQLHQLQAGWADLGDAIKVAAGNAITFLATSAGKALGTVGKGASRAFAERDFEQQDQARARELYEKATGEHLRPGVQPLDPGGALGIGPANENSFEKFLLQARSERGLAWQRLLAADAATQLAVLKAQTFGKLTAGTGPSSAGGAGQRPWDVNIAQIGAAYDWQPTDFWGRTESERASEAARGAGMDFLGGGAEGFGNTRGKSAGIFGKAFETIEADAKKFAEMEKMLQDRTTLLGGAFGALSDGLAAAVDAAITGSDNIGKAFMKASAAALKSLAIESSVRALYHGAAALGHLAMYDAPGAAAEAATAAGYAATAALAGAGAAILGSASGGFGGGGGGGGASTPAGGGSVSVGGAPQTPQGQQTIVYVGDGFVGRPDELAVAIADTLNHGVATGRVKTITRTAQGAVTFK